MSTLNEDIEKLGATAIRITDERNRLVVVLRETLAALHVARSRMGHFTFAESVQVDAAIEAANESLEQAAGSPRRKGKG